jgi:hypothetical protein
MRLAYVSLPGHGATDLFLSSLAAELAGRGLRLAGTVQRNTCPPGAQPCDMDLRVLPDGPTLRISENRGALALGCRLDPGALETAVVAVMDRLAGADLMLVNKFGRQEAEGRGLVPAIALALDRGMPVLVGVNALNVPAFLGFAGGLAQALPADRGAVRAWCLGA